MEKLVLEMSSIFKDPSLIDCIRQVFIDFGGKDYTNGIDLTNDESDDEIDDEYVRNFLRLAQTYLEKDLDYKTFKELLFAISSCILHKKIKPDIFFDHFFKKEEFNDIDIMILTTFYIYINEKMSNLERKTLYMTIHDKIRPIIFHNFLTPNNQSKFQNELMINILLISNYDEDKEIITKILPTFLKNNLFSTNSKINVLLSNFKEFIEILPQTSSSFAEILEFITKKDINLIFKMSEQASSLIIASVVSMRIKFPNIIKILDEKTVFPYIAVSHILKKYVPKANGFQLIDNLIKKAIECEFINPCIIASIDYTILHSFFLNETTRNKMLMLLYRKLESGIYKGDMHILLKTLIDVNFCRLINKKYFLEINELKYKELVEKFLKEKGSEINLFFMKKDCINLIDIVNRCGNNFKLKLKDNFVLIKFFKEEIDNKNWENVSLIGNYIIKTLLEKEIKEIINRFDIPTVIKRLFINKEYNNDNIDELIMNILCDPHPETNSELHKKLLDKMIEDEEIRESYYGYLICTTYEYSTPITSFLKRFYSEFKKDPDNFISAVKKQYIYNDKDKVLRKRMDFKISSLPVSKFGVSIVNKFISSIKEKPNNFQAFIALRNISSMYPFLFNVNTQEIFEITFANLDSFSIIFENKESREQLNQIKTAYSAISFLFYAFQSAPVIDKFMEWSLKNISSFSNAQVLCFLIIIHAQNSLLFVKWPLIVWFKRFDFLNIISDLIDRDIQNESFRTFYRETLLSVISETFLIMKQKQNKFNFIQIMELSNIENPFTYFYDAFFLNHPQSCYKITMPKLSQRFSLFVKNLNHIPFYSLFEHIYDEVGDDLGIELSLIINCYATNEIEEINYFEEEEEEEEFNEEESDENGEYNDDDHYGFHANNEHYFDYNVNDNIFNDDNLSFSDNKTKEINNAFTQKLTDSIIETNELPDLPKIPEYFTIKMARYLLSKPCFIYLYISHQSNIPLDAELHKVIFDTINKLNEMFENASSNNENDEDNRNIKDFDCTKEIISQSSLQHLIQKLISNQLFNSRNESLIKLLGQAIVSICENNENYYSIQFICQSFQDIYLQNQGNMNYISLNSIHRLIDILKILSKSELIKDHFFDFGGDLLLDTILTPDLRNDESLLLKFSSFLSSFKKNLPIKTTHLICFLINFNTDKSIKMAFELISKFDNEDLENVDQVLIKLLDRELKKNSLTDILKIFFQERPLVLQQRKSDIIKLLKECLKYILDIQIIGHIFTAIAPQRNNSTSLTRVIAKSEGLPANIFYTSPEFWSLFCRYKTRFINEINRKPSLLNSFMFLLDYPELISFETRSKYFRETIKKKIYKCKTLSFSIDRKDLLKSSFKSFKDLGSEEKFLNNIRIKFIGEKGFDAGGLKREWFTLLIQELFKKETGLFDYSVENSCYKLNPKSTNFEYIHFAGIVIARALIDGQLINANLSVPTWKDILHHPLNISDLESANKNLYSSLDWIQNNDVDPIEMTFVYSTVNNETIPLKKNGDQIKLTNKNKKEFVRLYSQYELDKSIEKQKKSFIEGFDSLISHEEIRIFTPNELNLLVCGIPKFDVNDFKKNMNYEHPLKSSSKVVQFFFSAISKWNDEQLAKLLFFMTGCSCVPANGFKEFNRITGNHLTIQAGGDSSKLPSAFTCSNTISLPDYKSEKEMNEKLLKAIELCNTFENF